MIETNQDKLAKHFAISRFCVITGENINLHTIKELTESNISELKDLDNTNFSVYPFDAPDFLARDIAQSTLFENHLVDVDYKILKLVNNIWKEIS